MRDLKRLQIQEKAKQERQRFNKVRGAEEDWNSEFQSTRQSLNFYPGKVEYNDEVQTALEKILGKKGLENLQMQGLKESAVKKNDDDEEDGEDVNGEEEEDGDKEDGEEEEDDKDEEKDDDEQGEEEEDDADKGKQTNKRSLDEEKEDKEDKEDKNELKKEPNIPIPKPVRPWDKPDLDERTEIIIGVRYNKPFENLFDDKQMLKERKPERIVRILAHYSAEFVVGIQFTYMTSDNEIVVGKFHGNTKKTLDNLQVVKFEIQYRERIEKVQVHFSKGIHWIEFFTNEGRSLLIGKKLKNGYPKAITRTKEVIGEKGEEVCYISGGYTGKDYRFTYLALHLKNGWGKTPKDEEGFGEMANGEEDA